MSSNRAAGKDILGTSRDPSPRPGPKGRRHDRDNKGKVKLLTHLVLQAGHGILRNLRGREDLVVPTYNGERVAVQAARRSHARETCWCGP